MSFLDLEGLSKYDSEIKKYINNKSSNAYFVGDTAPSTNQFWVKNGIIYYYDNNSNTWKTVAAVWS